VDGVAAAGEQPVRRLPPGRRGPARRPGRLPGG
jgi:hypothetical protein